MSFSRTVKEELVENINAARHCQISELASLIQYAGHFFKDEADVYKLRIQTENRFVAKKCFVLWKKVFGTTPKIAVRVHSGAGKAMVYIIETTELLELQKLLLTLKMVIIPAENECGLVQRDILLKHQCCKRAFLRGAYLAIGSMSDPDKSYHLEFVCQTQNAAKDLVEVLADFELDAKIVIRKKYFVVYLKEGEGIVDLLNIMEAHVALMNLENTRILKDMRNSINRRVNCETANIAKTVNAATKQVEDIQLIQTMMGIEKLPANLIQIAEVRLNYPDATLKELGDLLDPPIGKSGVNHRLRKLGEIAERLRGE